MSKMKCIARLFALMFALGAFAATASAQTQIGTVQGKVSDEQGAVLPGVNVTLTGPRGELTTVTDEKGEFRFVGVQPGTAAYKLKAELQGFAPQEREAITVELGKNAIVDFTMRISGITESVDVRAAASSLDVRSSATDTTVSNNMLQFTPLYSSTATGLLNAAPGINSDSAYGGQASYGNALLLDGVDTRDPEGGSAWTFFNQNLIEEIQVGGLGAPAEYGGFTGGIINTITKSGSNAFSGLFSMRYTKDSLASDNISSAVLQENPGLGNSAVTKKLTDYTVQMGGPLRRNKAFFFGSIQRYSALTDPSGPVANSQDISPRINMKFTLTPTAKDTFILGTQYDSYNVTGRVGYWPTNQAHDQQTVNEDAPEWVWNAQWRRVFGSNALIETKFTGYSGYYYLDPIDPSVFTFDGLTSEYSGGGGGQYYADRSRNQVQVALTKYAEKFGRHSFKFGAEIERSHVRSQYQPYGPAGFYIYAYGGVPYYRVSYGYDVQGDNRRTSAYAQDQWNAGRATINIGLRLDHIRGYSPVLKETVYKPDLSWGPRVGLAYDLTGNNTSAIKAFWGRYYEGAASAFFTAATPGIQDYTFTPINEDGTLGPPEVIVPAVTYGIANDIKHPRTDEFNVSFETQLMQGLRLTATGVWRNNSNFINNVIADARFAPVTLNNQLTGQPFTGYFWANQDASSSSFFIRNTEGFQYLATDGSVIATAHPERKYKGLILVLSNSLRGRFGYQASYVLSKSEGNVDNTGFGNWLNGVTWDSPNTAITNAYGELTNSRRHEVKIYSTYLVPKIDVMLGGSYTGRSGRPYTAFGQFSTSQLNLPASARRQIFLQPRGSEHNDFFHQVDLRAEKAFIIAAHRFGVYADINNLFNSAGVTTRQARYPSTTISDATVLFRAPTVIQGSRQVTFGGRWMF
jgi:hypothetical protein